MRADTLVASKVSVGTSAVLVSAFNNLKRYTIVQADKANTQLVYFDGSSGVTTASGFGEVEAGKSVTFLGRAAVYAIAGGASQNVRVIEGRDLV